MIAVSAGRRRGRPHDPNAKRHKTTRQGRRTKIDPVDRGTALLREKKRATTGREDVELMPAGVRYGHGHLDNVQYSSLGYVTALLRQTAAAMGGALTVAGLWQAVLGAATSGRRGMPPILGDADARGASPGSAPASTAVATWYSQSLARSRCRRSPCVPSRTD